MAKIKFDLGADIKSVNDALKHLPAFTLDNAEAAFRKMADIPSAEGMQRNIMLGMWRLGTLAKAAGKPFSPDKALSAYESVFYRQDVPTPRAVPSDGTLKKNRSAYSAFGKAAAEVPYDTFPVIARILAARNMDLTTRSGTLSRIRKEHDKVAPSAKVLESFFKSKEEATDDRTVEADISAACSSWERLSNAELAPKVLASAYLADVRKINEMILALHKKVAPKSKKPGEFATRIVELSKVTPIKRRAA